MCQTLCLEDWTGIEQHSCFRLLAKIQPCFQGRQQVWRARKLCGGIETASLNVDTCVWTWTLRGSGSFVIRFSLWACKFPIWILLTQESSSSASIGATRIPRVRRFSHGEGKVGCLLPISVSEPHVVLVVVVPLDLSLQLVLSANLRDWARHPHPQMLRSTPGIFFVRLWCWSRLDLMTWAKKVDSHDQVCDALDTFVLQHLERSWNTIGA